MLAEPLPAVNRGPYAVRGRPVALTLMVWVGRASVTPWLGASGARATPPDRPYSPKTRG